jgi:DNA-binding response OmpR family regulator
LRIYLQGEGYRVICAESGAETIRCVGEEEIHLVILDVMMPVLDGIHTAIKIREFSNVPIIFLSAKGEEADRVLGLQMGGDDYIVKPFTPMELFARVRAALRRYSELGGMADSENDSVYRTGGLMLDDEKKLVAVDNVPVNLTALEYNILELLISNPDHVFSSEQIYEAVRQEPAYDVSRIVSVHIRHIREKVESDPSRPRYVKLVYGLGYKVVSEA